MQLQGSQVGLWSPDLQKLKSVVSKRTLKSQQLVIVAEPPEEGQGRSVVINSEYFVDDLSELKKRVLAIASEMGQLVDRIPDAYHLFCKSRERSSSRTSQCTAQQAIQTGVIESNV